MNADPLQHVDQVRVWMDIVQLAGADQALNEPYMLGAQLRPAE